MKISAKFTVVLFCAFAAAPFLWHFVSALKDAGEVTQIPPSILPAHPTMANYSDLFRQRPFLTYCINSLIIAALSSLLCVTAGSLAAYRLARMPARPRTIMSSVLLVLAFFPPVTFLFPLYELVRTVGLINHYWGLIIPHAALNLPLTIWLLTGYFREIPKEIEEAAQIDGLGQFQILFRIIVPLAMPAIATAGILAFVASWNEYMLALTFMNADQARTVTVAIATLSGAFVYEIPWGLIAAGVVAGSLPLIVLTVFFQKRIVAGLTAGR
jgi:multiple sugar transport system permease protein